MKIAILGDKKSILGFKALGIDTYGIENKEEFKQVLIKISQIDYAILFITEELAKEYKDEVDELSQKPIPAVVVIPGVKGPTGEGLKTLKRIIERSLGSDILKIT